MSVLDWSIVVLFMTAMIALGALLSRRATASVDDYFLAGRKLPWWLIGFTKVASYTGSSAAFVLLVFDNGLVGNWMWWAIWVVWMPMMTVLWAKLWRRLRIMTDAEFLTERYSGKLAGTLRYLFALYTAFVICVTGMAVVSEWLTATAEVVMGVDGLVLIIVFASITFVYTLLSGMLGITYSDVPQFLVYLGANFVFMFYCVDVAGGWSVMYEKVIEKQGAAFLEPLPPGKSMPPLTLAVFLFQGMLTVASGSTAQRFAAARNEFHAILGQAMSTVMSLVVRVVPVIVVGIAAAAIFSPGMTDLSVIDPALDQDWAYTTPTDDQQPVLDSGRLYGLMIVLCAPVGLVGLLIVGELAGYMSTMDTYMNWGASLFINDVYRPRIAPGRSERHYVRASQAATGMMLVLAIVFAILLVEANQNWFLFLNSIMGVFALPAGMLRFGWWRFNKYAELVGLLGSYPLGYGVQWYGGTQGWEFWQIFLLLTGSGTVCMLIVSMATPAESMDQLGRFYRKCHPPGLWGPVRRYLGLTDDRSRIREYSSDAIDAVIMIGFSFGIVAACNAMLGLHWNLASACLAMSVFLGTVLVIRWRSRGFLTRLTDADDVGV